MPYGAGINQAPIGAPIAGGTPGSILFVGAGGVLAQDNANLFWDDANNRIGIRTNTPAQALDVVGNAQVSATLFGLGLLDISAAGAGQIKFPAVANPSADPNTLDDYEEGTWTPILTFTTPGDLNVSYIVQSGFYTKNGRDVAITGTIITSNFTHTTASGNAQLSGLPFTSLATAGSDSRSSVLWAGITKPGYTDIQTAITTNTNNILYTASGSGVGFSLVAASDMPSGGGVTLSATQIYYT
jgi:hypothetical protein